MPGGTFSKSARPKLPGSYVNWEAQLQTSVAAAIGSVVAIPFTHDWGPMDRAIHVGSLGEFKTVFGSSEDTPGFVAVKQAFLGEGLPGRGGAGEVVCYRAGGSAAAKAAHTFTNTTPASALTITAVYEGTRGNDLSVTIQDYAADSSKTELLVLDAGGVVLERYQFADTNVADLVAQINASSLWVKATQIITGVALTAVSSTALTGGNDGTTMIGSDWTALMAGLEVERFGLFAPYDLIDDTILASLLAWASNLNASGKRFMTVVGGALNEDISDATDRAGTLNNENFVTVGIGSVDDDELGILSTSQFAPRVAGALASRGESKSLTYARFAGIQLLNGATAAEAVTAFDNGVVVLGRDSNTVAPVRVEVGVTTYTGDTTQKPKYVFGDPKFVRTMESFEMEIAEYVEDLVIGQLQVNNKTRESVLSEMQSRLRRRADAGVIQSEWSAAIDQDPAPSDDDKFLAFVYGMKFGRAVEQVYSTIRAA